MDHNDPKLTAFVLGELADADAKELQTALDADPQLQREVDDIRRTVKQLETFLREEPLPPHLAGTPAPPKKVDQPQPKLKLWYPHTLVELLVVVSIVFVLIALMNPALQKASPRKHGSALTDRTMRSLGKPKAEERITYERHRYFSEQERAGGVVGTPTEPPGWSPRRNRDEPGSSGEYAFTPGSLRDEYDSLGNDKYSTFKENEFLKPQDAPFSTFSIDVDTASYSVARRYLLERNQLPPADAVRLEEFVNYFDYHDAPPTDGKPFATYVDVATCPWERSHLLARVALKGKEIPKDDRPPLNLVFLVDVSGSMSGPTRLPLVQKALVELTENLTEQDRVGIVTYAGNSRVALPSVSGREKRAIIESIEELSSGGSTAGAVGIKSAYELARKNFTKHGQNRVILCTDGDFNVGMSDDNSLQKLIETESKSGVFLTVLGFGMGNHNDRMLEILADKGNGNYGYVDNIEEARKLLVEGLTGTLITIAKDVKIQIDFNPKRVAAYRLLGYENRKLRDEDFHNDKIDAGEIGAGHSVTALYEIVPVGAKIPATVDKSRYATDKTDDVSRVARDALESPTDAELMLVKLRFKAPDAEKSELLETPIVAEAKNMSSDFEFAASVALFGMLLRDSKYSGDGNWETVKELAKAGSGSDKYRNEFLEIVDRARTLK